MRKRKRGRAPLETEAVATPVNNGKIEQVQGIGNGEADARANQSAPMIARRNGSHEKGIISRLHEEINGRVALRQGEVGDRRVNRLKIHRGQSQQHHRRNGQEVFGIKQFDEERQQRHDQEQQRRHQQQADIDLAVDGQIARRHVLIYRRKPRIIVRIEREEHQPRIAHRQRAAGGEQA